MLQEVDNFNFEGVHSYQKGRVGKIGDCYKKQGVSLIFILTSPFQCDLWVFGEWVCVCVCRLFTPFHQINRYMSSTRVNFEKKRHYGEKKFDISELFIQFTINSYCEHITSGVWIDLYIYIYIYIYIIYIYISIHNTLSTECSNLTEAR